MQDRVRAFFDSLADRWDSLAVHPRERVAFVLDQAGPLSGASVLDIGCGTGVLEGPLLERVGPSGKVLGLDLSASMLELASAKHRAANLAFIQADFLDWPSRETFDLVVAYSCFPHFPDYPAFFAAAARRLSPGGRLLVAHIEGREAINGLHGSSAGEVSRPLPPVGEAARMAEEAGLGAVLMRDDGDYWVLLAGPRSSREGLGT